MSSRLCRRKYNPRTGSLAGETRPSFAGHFALFCASFFVLVSAASGAAPRRVTEQQDADLARGVENLEQKNWREAISSFRRSLDKDPNRTDTLFYLSQAYFLDGRLDSALPTIAKAARLAPASGAIQQKYGEYLCEAARCAKGLALLLDARRLDPSLEHIDLDVGMAYYRLSNLDFAIRTLEDAVKHEPANATAAFFLAECYSIHADFPQAEKMYRLALSLGKKDGATYYGLGRSLLRQRDAQQALAMFQNALAADPSLEGCHFLMASALRSLGRSEEARQQMKVFETLHKATARSAETNSISAPEQEAFWGGCRRLLERGDEPAALARLHSVDGGQHPYYLLGTLYYSMGRFRDARRALAISVAKEPKRANSLAWLGRTEFADGHLPEAEVSLKQALQLDPENEPGMAGIGAVRHFQRQWAESAEWIAQSKTRDPEILLDLCDDYLELGRRNDAELAAELVKSFGADDKTIQGALDKLMSRR